MPVFVIIKVGTLADGMGTPAYQIAMRQDAPGLTWYDVHGTPGPNDPTTLDKAAIRMDVLNKRVSDTVKGLNRLRMIDVTAANILRGLRSLLDDAEWNADFRQELLDFVDGELKQVDR